MIVAFVAVAVVAVAVGTVLGLQARGSTSQTTASVAESSSSSTSTTTSTTLTVDMIAKVQASVAVISAGTGSGSGFLVAPEMLLTSAHVVQYSTQVTVQIGQQQELNGTVKSLNPDADLALVAVPGLDALPLEFFEGELRAGSECYAVGSPLGLEQSVSKGIVSNPSRISDGVRYIQTDAPINPGNSGGPIIDSAGNVIGIVTLKLSDTEGMGFGVAYDELARFLFEIDQGKWAYQTTTTLSGEEEWPRIVEAIQASDLHGLEVAVNYQINHPKFYQDWAGVFVSIDDGMEILDYSVLLRRSSSGWAVLMWEDSITTERETWVSIGAPEEIVEFLTREAWWRN